MSGNSEKRALLAQAAQLAGLANQLLIAVSEFAGEPAAAAAEAAAPKARKENMGVADAAEYCGYSKSYMYQLVHRREIPHYRPTGGRLIFKRAELDEFTGRNKKSSSSELREQAAAILNGEA